MTEDREKILEAFLQVVTERLKAYVPRGRAEAEARDARGEFLKALGPEPKKKTTRKKRSRK